MADQVSPLPVEAGLYILQYVRSLSGGAPPSVEVRVPGEAGRYVQVVSSPFDSPNTIGEPGGCLVIRADRSATLQVAVVSAAGSRAGEAELRLEPLVSGRSASPRRDAPAARAATTGLVGVAHVSRRGDVPVGDGVWIAGPEAPAPIEGLEVRVGDARSDLRLEYQVLVGGTGGGWTPWLCGDYAGTRGQARPLLGIRLRLSGGAAQSVTIAAEALFLGATIETARGDVIELISGAGVDPLVGLKIAFVPVPSGAVKGKSNPVQSRQVQQAEPRTGRVRVFRASGLR